MSSEYIPALPASHAELLVALQAPKALQVQQVLQSAGNAYDHNQRD
jgi:hypothetical protein